MAFVDVDVIVTVPEIPDQINPLSKFQVIGSRSVAAVDPKSIASDDETATVPPELVSALIFTISPAASVPYGGVVPVKIVIEFHAPAAPADAASALVVPSPQ